MEGDLQRSDTIGSTARRLVERFWTIVHPRVSFAPVPLGVGDLISLCERLDLTRPELAKLLGVEPRSLHRWYTGVSSPTGAPAALLDALWEMSNESRSLRLVRPLAQSAVRHQDGLRYFLVRLMQNHVTLAEIKT